MLVANVKRPRSQVSDLYSSFGIVHSLKSSRLKRKFEVLPGDFNETVYQTAPYRRHEMISKCYRTSREIIAIETP